MSALSNNPLWSFVIGTCIVGLIVWVVRSPFWAFWKRQWLKVWTVLVAEPFGVWLEKIISPIVNNELQPVIEEQTKLREELVSHMEKEGQDVTRLEEGQRQIKLQLTSMSPSAEQAS